MNFNIYVGDFVMYAFACIMNGDSFGKSWNCFKIKIEKYAMRQLKLKQNILHLKENDEHCSCSFIMFDIKIK